MKIGKKFIVFLSILFLGTGVMLGCGGGEDEFAQPEPGREAPPPEAAPPEAAPPPPPPAPEQSREQSAMEPPQGQEQARMEQTQEPPATSGEQQAEQGTAGGDRTMAQSGQASEDWIDKQVVSNDDQELGTVAALHDSGYVMIRGEGDRLHPVPADLLEEDSQGDRLTASFDQNTFQQAPSFSEAEQQQLSDSQLEEVRGYYEKSESEGGQQMPSGESQGQQPGQDSQYQDPNRPPESGTQQQGS